jgi:hypothetical protein
MKERCPTLGVFGNFVDKKCDFNQMPKNISFGVHFSKIAILKCIKFAFSNCRNFFFFLMLNCDFTKHLTIFLKITFQIPCF